MSKHAAAASKPVPTYDEIKAILEKLSDENLGKQVLLTVLEKGGAEEFAGFVERICSLNANGDASLMKRFINHWMHGSVLTSRGSALLDAEDRAHIESLPENSGITRRRVLGGLTALAGVGGGGWITAAAYQKSQQPNLTPDQKKDARNGLFAGPSLAGIGALAGWAITNDMDLHGRINSVAQVIDQLSKAPSFGLVR